jgi:hypothetical protein
MTDNIQSFLGSCLGLDTFRLAQDLPKAGPQRQETKMKSSTYLRALVSRIVSQPLQSGATNIQAIRLAHHAAPTGTNPTLKH